LLDGQLVFLRGNQSGRLSTFLVVSDV